MSLDNSEKKTLEKLADYMQQGDTIGAEVSFFLVSVLFVLILRRNYVSHITKYLFSYIFLVGLCMRCDHHDDVVV